MTVAPKATAATANPDAKYGTDLSGETSYTVTTSDSEGNYGLHGVTLEFKGKTIKTAAMGRYQGIRAMAGSTAVPGCKAQLVIKGTDKTVMRYVPAAGNGHVLPYTDGLLRVQKGGEVIQKIQKLEKITADDLKELERILWQELGTKDEYEDSTDIDNLAVFIRSLVGVSQDTINEKFGEFLNGNTLNAQQQEFVKGIIHIEKEEIVELYVDPFFQNQKIGSQLIEYAKNLTF